MKFSIIDASEIDNAIDIWNTTEPKYQDYDLEESIVEQNDCVTTTGNNVEEQSKEIKDTEYSSTNITQRKIFRTLKPTTSSLRSKVILDQLNAALSTKKPKSKVKLNDTLSLRPARVHLQRSSSRKMTPFQKKQLEDHLRKLTTSFRWYNFDLVTCLFMMFVSTFLFALALPDPICLNEE